MKWNLINWIAVSLILCIYFYVMFPPSDIRQIPLALATYTFTVSIWLALPALISYGVYRSPRYTNLWGLAFYLSFIGTVIAVTILYVVTVLFRGMSL